MDKWDAVLALIIATFVIVFALIIGHYSEGIDRCGPGTALVVQQNPDASWESEGVCMRIEDLR